MKRKEILEMDEHENRYIHISNKFLIYSILIIIYYISIFSIMRVIGKYAPDDTFLLVNDIGIFTTIFLFIGLTIIVMLPLVSLLIQNYNTEL